MTHYCNIQLNSAYLIYCVVAPTPQHCHATRILVNIAIPSEGLFICICRLSLVAYHVACHFIINIHVEMYIYSL